MIAVVVAVACGVVLGAAPAVAVNPTVYSITPRRKLVDQSTITIAWSNAPFGRKPHDAYILVYWECTPAWKTTHSVGRSCNDGGATVMGPPTQNGSTGSIDWYVTAGSIGSDGGTCGTSAADSKCLLVLREMDQRHQYSSAPRAMPIRFAVPE